MTLSLPAEMQAGKAIDEGAQAWVYVGTNEPGEDGMDMKKLWIRLVALGGRQPPGLTRSRLMYTILVLLACIWSQGCSASHVHVSPDPAAVSEVRQVMHRYLAAFNVDDFETIGASWHAPGWLSTSESRRPLKDREEVKSLYRALLGKIRAEDYDHSELLSEDIEFVNDGCVIYRITFTRWKRDGSFMPPRVRGSVCTLLKVDGQWGLSNVALEPGTGH